MLIGTWNLEGRWSAEHLALLEAWPCEVWLLTEVSDQVDVPGYTTHRTSELIAARRAWAAVLTRGAGRPLADPHPASAAVTLDGTTYCSSILPWRSAGPRHPWVGRLHAEKTSAAVAALDAALPDGPLVWGGDWNVALDGPEQSGSKGGRQAVADLLVRRRLQVPTRGLLHRLGRLSIDHIAVDAEATVSRAERFRADGRSDHDGYVVEVVDAG